MAATALQSQTPAPALPDKPQAAQPAASATASSGAPVLALEETKETSKVRGTPIRAGQHPNPAAEKMPRSRSKLDDKHQPVSPNAKGLRMKGKVRGKQLHSTDGPPAALDEELPDPEADDADDPEPVPYPHRWRRNHTSRARAVVGQTVRTLNQNESAQSSHRKVPSGSANQTTRNAAAAPPKSLKSDNFNSPIWALATNPETTEQLASFWERRKSANVDMKKRVPPTNSLADQLPPTITEMQLDSSTTSSPKAVNVQPPPGTQLAQHIPQDAASLSESATLTIPSGASSSMGASSSISETKEVSPSPPPAKGVMEPINFAPRRRSLGGKSTVSESPSLLSVLSSAPSKAAAALGQTKRPLVVGSGTPSVSFTDFEKQMERAQMKIDIPTAIPEHHNDASHHPETPVGVPPDLGHSVQVKPDEILQDEIAVFHEPPEHDHDNPRKLPRHWRQVYSRSRKKYYYFNEMTGESCWRLAEALKAERLRRLAQDSESESGSEHSINDLVPFVDPDNQEFPELTVGETTGQVTRERRFSSPQSETLALLRQWRLDCYYKAFIRDGWEDPTDWVDVSEEDFDSLGMSSGHVRRFKKKLADYMKDKALVNPYEVVAEQGNAQMLEDKNAIDDLFGEHIKNVLLQGDRDRDGYLSWDEFEEAVPLFYPHAPDEIANVFIELCQGERHGIPLQTIETCPGIKMMRLFLEI